jgi:hypothetical protein
MKLVKGFSPVLDCHIWKLQQWVPEIEGHCERQLAIHRIEVERFSYPRLFLAMRLRQARRDIRKTIADYLKERTRVQEVS